MRNALVQCTLSVTLVEMGFVSASLVALHENTAPSSSMLGVKVNTLVVAAIFSLTDDVVVLDATPLVIGSSLRCHVREGAGLASFD